jgi:ABC-type antimicrobial peptide transport system permease subunit
MLKSYIKLAYRNLLRNKLSSLINIFGLSVAIGCSIVFFLLLDLEYTSDRFHKNAENIFMVGYTLQGDQRAQRWGDTPRAIGPALETEFPQVSRAVRVADRSAIFSHEDKVFRESIRFVDPEFLQMFTFPLELGNASVLYDKNAVILNAEIAEKYFGEANPIGMQIEMVFNNKYRETFFIRGVAVKLPINASFGFDVLVSYEKLADMSDMDGNDWGIFTTATFIQVDNPNAISVISEQTNRFVERHNAVRVDRPIASFIFEPLPTLSWESQEIRNSISSGSTPQALILLFVIGLFLLLQACVNYINISLASGTRRLKEIGIRKVVGSNRYQIIKQFLGENLLLCFFALIGGLFLTEFIFLPGLFQITGHRESVSLIDLFINTHLWMFLILLLMFTGVGAGAYPSLVISKLQSVSILTHKIKISGKKRFTSILLAFQFGITFIILCLVVAFWQNNRYQQQRDWGYNQEHVINIQLEQGEQFAILKNVLDQNPNVIQTAGTMNLIGRSTQQAVVEIEAIKHETILFDVGLQYLETLGIRLREGRFFDPAFTTDRYEALVVNEQFMNEVGWQQALNQTVRYEEKIYRIIGAIQDFHYTFFFEEIRPIIFRIAPEETFRYLSVRVKAGTGIQSMKTFQETWRSLFPDSPFQAFFQDSVFERAFRNNAVITRIFVATACITLIISCMGLFGLVTLMISKKMKDLSIHKVLGASVVHIANMIIRRFVILLTVSTVLALPISYIFLNALLDGVYKYHMALGFLPFLSAATLVLLSAILTIATQVYKAAVRNPIDTLRYE